MGLFDEIICKYPLPGNPPADLVWQTNDTPAQYLDTYVIETDGTLWHEEYDIADRSDKALGIGTDEFCGCVSRVNERLVPMPDFCGCIVFYGDVWAFSALFDKGKLLSVEAFE